jgi:parvulin-like peptidyl-prolyl isomerase
MKTACFRAVKIGEWVSLAALPLLALASVNAWAVDAAGVIAESSRAKVTVADYQAEIDKLPPAARAEFAANHLRLTQFLDTLYTSSAMAADARKSGLDRDPVLSRQIAIQVDRMLATARYAQLDAEASAAFDKAIAAYTARAQELYASTKSKYAVPEQVRVAHILVYPRGNDADTQKRLEEIRAKAVAGADFNALAREYSDDPSVKSNSGELGFFEAKPMDPAFAAAAFAMKTKGEISAPVKSSFGWHIILFEDRRPAGYRTFDEVKPQILAEMRQRAIDENRAANTRAIFSDPTLKVNNDLIEQIYTEGAATTHTLQTAPPPKP